MVAWRDSDIYRTAIYCRSVERNASPSSDREVVVTLVASCTMLIATGADFDGQILRRIHGSIGETTDSLALQRRSLREPFSGTAAASFFANVRT
jgi:hypothetical protein